MRRRLSVGLASLCSVTVLLWFSLGGVPSAMIRTLPLEELVSRSDAIVIALVYSVTATKVDPSSKIITLQNELKTVELLKGSLPNQQPIILITRRHETHWMEDNVELPPPGSRVVLFLRQSGDGMVPVNGIQGVWPMQGEKLLQMGTGKTLDDIRKILKSQRPFRRGQK
jgi:hypothetical protein